MSLSISAFVPRPVEAAAEALSTADRERATRVLRDALPTRGEWVSVRAAEALMAAGESAEPVLEAFRPQADATKPQYRIGVWRVLARAEPDAAAQLQYVERIRRVLIDATETDRVHAVEALAKLNAPIMSDAERRAVDGMAADAAAGPFGLWRLVQAGDGKAVERLRASLTGENEIGRLRAAYVLGILIPADAPSAARKAEAARRAILTAAAPTDVRAAVLDLAEWGGDGDRGLLMPLLDHVDADVRVAAATALLRIGDRAKQATSRPSTGRRPAAQH